jgi:hypothetical protein
VRKGSKIRPVTLGDGYKSFTCPRDGGRRDRISRSTLVRTSRGPLFGFRYIASQDQFLAAVLDSGGQNRSPRMAGFVTGTGSRVCDWRSNVRFNLGQPPIRLIGVLPRQDCQAGAPILTETDGASPTDTTDGALPTDTVPGPSRLLVFAAGLIAMHRFARKSK